MFKNKRILLIGGGILLVAIIGFTVFGKKGSDEASIIVEVQQGEFVVDVTTTGELQAINSTKILAPGALREYRIHQVNILNIIDEGTFVKKGDFVAQLDPSELKNRMEEVQLSVDREESQYIQTQLDTALQMRQSRDELINLRYGVEEKELVLEQSQFEPPATIKQAQINLDKAIRALKQAEENYLIKRKQNIAKMQEVAVNRQKRRLELQGLQDLQKDFTIMAPEDGMLIYRKNWDGTAIKAGSQIRAWDPVVAELPDLSAMNSITYVNEVDIRRIIVGQKVDIGLDAFPDKKLSGKVTRVANVGEQRPNSDAKVFQVTIELDRIDDTIRPGMTTSNKIYTSVIENALYVPLECLHNFADSITYVYRSDGINYTKQEVQVGQTNANSAQILLGLENGESLYMSIPGENESKIELLEELNGKRNLPEPEPKKEEPRKRGPRGEGFRNKRPDA